MMYVVDASSSGLLGSALLVQAQCVVTLRSLHALLFFSNESNRKDLIALLLKPTTSLGCGLKQYKACLLPTSGRPFCQ
jgi:hypothetical protein